MNKVSDDYLETGFTLKLKKKNYLWTLYPSKLEEEVREAPFGRTKRKRKGVKSQPHNTPSKSNLSLKLLSRTLHFKLHCEIVLKENTGKRRIFWVNHINKLTRTKRRKT